MSLGGVNGQKSIIPLIAKISDDDIPSITLKRQVQVAGAEVKRESYAIYFSNENDVEYTLTWRA